MLDELFPVLEVLDVDDAGEDAEEAVVSVELPSPTIRELPLGGEEADATTDDLDELPGGDVRLMPDLLVPGKGVGLFREVDVVRSCGEATLVDEVESAYLQLDVDGTDEDDVPCRRGVVESW